jgi:hypothetical protein
MTVTLKEETLITFLLGFYKDKIQILKDIVYQNNPLSLRIIDWLVTNYSKKYNVIYPLFKNNGDIVYFNIYLDYKNQLKAYSKKFFDPFCRQRRIIINCDLFTWKDCPLDISGLDKNTYIVTTVGQLNFFKWFLENKIFDYAISNIKLIDFDMGSIFINRKKGKRIVLSESAVKGVFTSPTTVILKF